MTLDRLIEEAKDFCMWLHEQTNGKKFPIRRREQTGLSILQHSLDVDDAIIVLLEANLPGIAMTLARPLFESYVRGFWLLKCATDEQVDDFIEGKCSKFSKLLKNIPNDNESGGAWIHNNAKENLNSFHDLTHGGSKHVERRTTLKAIEPNYPEQELASLLKFGIEIRIRIGMELLTRIENIDDLALRFLNEKAQAYRKFSKE